MVIVETTVLVDLFNGTSTPQTEWMMRFSNTVEIGLTDLILCEVLQGIGDEFRFAKVRRALLELPILPNGGTAIALAAAINYRSLRKRGITVRKTVDSLIATFCIENGHQLLQNDRDYVPFEEHLGLKLIRP
jgi:predicted nucleic acid-binding protein